MSVKRAGICCALALAILGAIPAASLASDTANQFWPELDLYHRFNENARLRLSLSPVREVSGSGQRSTLDDVDTGIDLDTGLFPIGRTRREEARYDSDRMKYLRFRTGVHYLDVNGEAARDEWRIVAELTPRSQLPLDMILALRNRFDLRWIGDAYSWRYRPRLELDREFKVGTQMALLPYASAELFWDSRSDSWTRTLYKVGTGVAVRPWFEPKIYWAYQIDDGLAGDTITQALGLLLAFHI
ncbi:MAG: DUF2490 domain-containing protein [Candidatus Krumholzibacteria bacterium]|nr:DUF2490 domain-containing protein [Candidatus Krumholzibacteria bacterium]